MFIEGYRQLDEEERPVTAFTDKQAMAAVSRAMNPLLIRWGGKVKSSAGKRGEARPLKFILRLIFEKEIENGNVDQYLRSGKLTMNMDT